MYDSRALFPPRFFAYIIYIFVNPDPSLTVASLVKRPGTRRECSCRTPFICNMASSKAKVRKKATEVKKPTPSRRTIRPKRLRCTAGTCRRTIEEQIDVQEHPILHVLLCEGCRYTLNDQFPVGEDGHEDYCCWCGEGGDELVMWYGLWWGGVGVQVRVVLER